MYRETFALSKGSHNSRKTILSSKLCYWTRTASDKGIFHVFERFLNGHRYTCPIGVLKKENDRVRVLNTRWAQTQMPKNRTIFVFLVSAKVKS